MLLDAPVSYNAFTLMLFTLTLYRKTIAELALSVVTSFITMSSQSDSELVLLSYIPPMSCSASSVE